MREHYFKRIISVILILAMLVTSNSLLLHVFSSEALPVGVGIYNHVLTSEDNGSAKYVLRFYRHSYADGTANPVAFPHEMQISGSKYLSPNSVSSPNDSAYIYLDKDEQIVFSESPAFIKFCRENQVDEVEISYEYGRLNQQETSVLYSEKVQSFIFWEKVTSINPFTGQIITRWRPTYASGDNPFANMTEHIKEYDSTPMTTFTVEQNWRDRGTGRPGVDEVHFDIYQDNAMLLDHDTAVLNTDLGTYEYTVSDNNVYSGSYKAYLEAEASNSSTYLYEYSVPECAPDGHAYSYSSQQIFPESYEDSYIQGEHPDNDPDRYLSIGLTQFSFDLKWADSYDHSARPTVNADFIKSYFTLYKKVGDTEEAVPFWPDGISDEEIADYFTVSGNTVTIKRLEDIKADGTANEYVLKLKDDIETIPIKQSARKADPVNDYYAVKSENTGLHTSEIDKTYDGGEIRLTLTGKTTLDVNIEWRDNMTREIREADDTAAELSLWRFSDQGNPEDIDDAAMVSTKLIKGSRGNHTVNYRNLPKYDYFGRIYTYYAVEKPTVEEEIPPEQEGDDPTYVKQPYVAEYQDENVKKLFDGDTVVNRLSEKIEYSVSADWTAASRQGGTADVVYRLQRRESGAEDWEEIYVPDVESTEPTEPGAPEPTVPLELTVRYDEHHMSRYGDEECKFPEVEVYDDNGGLYEYRVVQTSMTRSDVLTEGQQPVESTDTTLIGDSLGGDTTTEHETITVNDEYAVTLTRRDENKTEDKDGTDFHFDYVIQGDSFVKIIKRWVTENRNPLDTTQWEDQNHQIVQNPDYAAKFNVQNFNIDAHEYRDYFVEDEYPEGYFDEYVNSGYFYRETVGSEPDVEHRVVFDQSVLNNTTGWTLDNIPVPKYDQKGREIAYRSIEVDEHNTYPRYPNYQWCEDGVFRKVSFYTRYSWDYETFGENNLSTKYSLIATNIRTYEGDDYGEISIRKEWIDDGELEFRRPINIYASENLYRDTAQSQTLNKQNIWEGRFVMKTRYKRDANNQRIIDENGYYVLDPENSYMYDDADFYEGPVDPEEGETYYWSAEEINEIMTQSGGSLSEEEEWIYNLLSSKTWNGADYSSRITADNSIDLKDSNAVDFSGFAGIYKSAPIDGNPSRCHYYAVRQKYTPGGVNDVLGTLEFINTRIGVVSYEVLFDWNVGAAIENGEISSVDLRIAGDGLQDSVQQVITPSDLVPVIKDGKQYYAYYILNLSKYDTDGKLINYSVEEVKINDVEPDEDGVVMVGDNRCVIEIGSETVTEGPVARSDDLKTIIITNTYEDEEEISVHKQWVDNSNADETRTDLYIKLYRISQKPGSTAVLLPGDEDGEYKWTQDEDDSENYWTYRFDELPKYDPQGYPYTYYVCEQEPERLPGYKQEFESNADNNPKVYLTTAQLAEDTYSTVVFDGGTITNRLYGELTVTGEKLWQNMSSLLQKRDYPIATVELYRDFSEMSDEDFAKLVQRAGLTGNEITDREVLISSTTVRSGATAFRFTDVEPSALSRGFVIMEDASTPKTDENGGIILPKYDELGIRLSYKLKEMPINGYLSKIEQGSQKLINEHHGGVKLRFAVTKHWEGMEEEHIFPTITFTLHQVFRINDGTDEEPQYRYYEMNHFEREFKATDYQDHTVTFGDAAHPEEANALRYYSPIGEPFTYFVTETLSNYDGERVIFVEADKAEMIPQFLAPYHTGNSEIILLDENRSGKALGFTSTITDALDDPADVIRESGAATADEASPEDPPAHRTVEEYLNDKDAEPVALDETVTNTYQPDAQNFQGSIEISKQWDTLNNTEYDAVKAYSFTLSRYTKLANKETLFRVTTTDTLSGENAVPHFSDLAEGISMTGTDHGITAHDFLPSMNEATVMPPAEGQQPKYYIGVLLKDRKAVTVVIDTSEGGYFPGRFNNKVTISGLAIYGHDALKYYYTVTEDPKPGFTLVTGSDTKQLEQESTPQVRLSNRLNAFDLKIHKSFGKEFEDTDGNTYIEPIERADFDQFFNDDYFRQLTFDLHRSSSAVPAEVFQTVTGGDIKDALTAGGANCPAQSEAKGYAYTFSDLPLTDVYGNLFTYWVTETDGAQTGVDDKVYTRYSDSEYLREEKPDPVSHDPDVIALVDADNGTDKDTYVQNVFKAKKITINKYWLDGNNEDGMRPEELSVVVKEKMPGIQQPKLIYLTLNKESAAGEIGWRAEKILPRYYFNGTQTIDGIQYQINEVRPDEYTLVETAGTYGGEGTSDPNTYVIPGYVGGTFVPVSDTSYKPIGGDGATGSSTFDELNLTNYKLPQKGALTLNKRFSALDENFKEDTRPANLYFKLTDENGTAFTLSDYTAFKMTVKVGANTVTPSAGGVITVPRNADCSYPAVTVYNLPMGTMTGAGLQANGSAYVFEYYKFAECQADGSALAATFPYTWRGGTEVTPWDFWDEENPFEGSYTVTNTLKTENHTVKKQWNDDANNNIPNYYRTRPDHFIVRLERTTVKDSTLQSDWTTVFDNINLTTNPSSLDTDDNYSSDSSFRNLPQYDGSGNKYYYRVVETYIGPTQDDKYDTSRHSYTIPGTSEVCPASNVYYVQYDSDLSDTQTLIRNHLIRKTEYRNYIAQKIWNDNLNQDGKREPVTVKLIQFTTDRNNPVREIPEILNEDNNWFYQWSNYPKFDEDGNEYQYAVEEVSDLSPVYSAHSVFSQSEEEDKDKEDSFSRVDITNTHTQETRSLSVDKNWLNKQTRDKQLRPESIEFVLCCQYTAYKYVSEDPDTHEQTDLTTNAAIEAAYADQTLRIVENTAKSYDGPVNYDGSTAAQLLSYYPDTALDSGYDPTDPTAVKTYNYTQTLTPSDKLDDDQWKGAIRFDNLPVYINTCATDRYDGREYAIRYYVKEVEPTLAQGASNPYVYGVSRIEKNSENVDVTILPYKAEGEGTSPATALLDENNVEADQTVITSNKLKTREVTVTKVWEDHGYGDSLHYDIDFTLTCTNAADGFAYTQTLTLDKDAIDSQDLHVYHVTFTDLPIYRKDGVMLTYAVTEKVHVESGTAPDVRYGYVQSTPDATYENGILRDYTITNTLPVVHLKADKTWRDNNNQDGQRPDALNFTLTGAADGVTDITVPASGSLSDGSSNYTGDSADTRWKQDYGIQPLYNAENHPYTFTAAEAASSGASLSARGYIRYVDASGVTDYLDRNDYSIVLDSGAAPDEITTETALDA